jgi:hypothetical protein
MRKLNGSRPACIPAGYHAGETRYLPQNRAQSSFWIVRGGNLNQAAHKAIEDLWNQTVKARALCPYQSSSAVGATEYTSPAWYKQRGALYVVSFTTQTSEDVQELREVAAFINRSFVISMHAVLEAHSVVPYKTEPDTRLPGGKHAQLTKWFHCGPADVCL